MHRENMTMEIHKEKICGRRIVVFHIRTQKSLKKFLIGVQVSKLLQRQTFNLYRSMKLKGIELTRASPQEIGFLLHSRSIRHNIHSVTLVPYDKGKAFILENWKGVPPSTTPTRSTSLSPLNSFAPTPLPSLSSSPLNFSTSSTTFPKKPLNESFSVLASSSCCPPPPPAGPSPMNLRAIDFQSHSINPPFSTMTFSAPVGPCDFTTKKEESHFLPPPQSPPAMTASMTPSPPRRSPLEFDEQTAISSLLCLGTSSP